MYLNRFCHNQLYLVGIIVFLGVLNCRDRNLIMFFVKIPKKGMC